MATAMTMTGRAVDSQATANPVMMLVAGPVSDASAIERTGRYLYSV